MIVWDHTTASRCTSGTGGTAGKQLHQHEVYEDGCNERVFWRASEFGSTCTDVVGPNRKAG